MGLKEDFDRLSSISEITRLKKESSSEDGEYSWFEEKGIKPSFTKDCKKNLSKEICAFSNTYGGIILCHFGDRNTLEEYPKTDIGLFHTKLEDWLGSCIEPRSLGFDLKTVEGVFLIHIPESRNKPHRAKDKKYYYRHITQSCPMPEIMISSMYRSQAFLETDCTLLLVKKAGSINVTLTIKNNSDLSGSMPKIRIAMANANSGENSGILHFQGNSIQKPVITQFDDLTEKLDGVKFNYIESNSDIQSLILYPNDMLPFRMSVKEEDRNSSNLFLVFVDYFFKETNKKRYVFLLEVDDNGSCQDISCSEHSSQATLHKFNNLRNALKKDSG